MLCHTSRIHILLMYMLKCMLSCLMILEVNPVCAHAHLLQQFLWFQPLMESLPWYSVQAGC